MHCGPGEPPVPAVVSVPPPAPAATVVVVDVVETFKQPFTLSVAWLQTVWPQPALLAQAQMTRDTIAKQKGAGAGPGRFILFGLS